MQRSERLRVLADKVRTGTRIDWRIELDAMALEQAAQDAEYAEEIAKRHSLELQRLSGERDQGSEAESNDGSEVP